MPRYKEIFPHCFENGHLSAAKRPIRHARHCPGNQGLLDVGTSLHSQFPFSDKPPGNAMNLDLTLNLWGRFPVVDQMPVGMAGVLS